MNTLRRVAVVSAIFMVVTTALASMVFAAPTTASLTRRTTPLYNRGLDDPDENDLFPAPKRRPLSTAGQTSTDKDKFGYNELGSNPYTWKFVLSTPLPDHHYPKPDISPSREETHVGAAETKTVGATVTKAAGTKGGKAGSPGAVVN